MVFAALFLVLYNGQLLGWAIFNPQMQKLDYEEIYPYDKKTVHFYANLWFWGVSLGSFMCVGMAVMEKTRTIYVSPNFNIIFHQIYTNLVVIFREYA